MEIPANYSAKFTKPLTAPAERSERDELLQRFLDRVNPTRVRDGFAPYTHGRLARMVSAAGYETADLHRLFKECDGAAHFSKLFHWKLRQRTKPQSA